MEKKSYVPKVTKFSPVKDGSGLVTSLPEMKCVHFGCNNTLRPEQVYDVLRGKSKGNCSKKCGQNKHPVLFKNCAVCGTSFSRQENYMTRKNKTCSLKCAGMLSSKRMMDDNPMHHEVNVQKMRQSLIDIGHKPYVQGGNGRGASRHQLLLYNELSKSEDSFEMEVIEKTGKMRRQFAAPNHYKIDIASRRLMIAIEIDGKSHCIKKVKECDSRKNHILALRGWRVLRFTNSAIKNELQSCVQKVLSMISA